MSEEDIQRQVGAAVLAYSEAKVRLAHSEQLLRGVADSYRLAATALDNHAGARFTTAEEVAAAVHLPGNVLIGSDRLRELLEDHSRIRTAVELTQERMRELGVNVA
jgi:hypothetical protein